MRQIKVEPKTARYQIQSPYMFDFNESLYTTAANNENGSSSEAKPTICISEAAHVIFPPPR